VSLCVTLCHFVSLCTLRHSASLCVDAHRCTAVYREAIQSGISQDAPSNLTVETIMRDMYDPKYAPLISVKDYF
jgi:hypothetical protein